MKWSRLQSLLISGSLILLLSACTSSGMDSPPAGEALQQQLQQSKEDQGQTITLKKTTDSNITKDTGGQQQEAGYRIQTRLTDFQLLSAKAGLAWGITRNELRIYTTQDNGATWANVSPAKTVTFSESPVYGNSIFFLNQNNGWVARNANGVGQTLILHTIDGGQNWNVKTFNHDAVILGMYFINETTGWVMTSTEDTDSNQDKALYRTEDGGQSWTKLMQNSGTVPSDQVTPNAIPAEGKMVGMSFLNAKKGFVTLNTNGSPEVYITSDGGKKWSPGTDLTKKHEQECSQLTAGKPHLFDNASEGWMNIGCTMNNKTRYFGYFTSDGGQSWSFTPFDLKAQTGINQAVGPTFLNKKNGWSLVDGVIYRTKDQGKNWNALPVSSTLQKTIVNYPEIVKLQFFSDQVGWLLVAKNEERRSLLMQTTDGGKTWHVL